MAEQRNNQRGDTQRKESERAEQEARDRYLREAKRLYWDMTPQEAEKELKRLERGKGVLGWLRKRWDGFWNMVKIAMYSVLLGRQVTERRIISGNREEASNLQREEMKKETRISVLEEKIMESRQKEQPEQEERENVSNQTEPQKEWEEMEPAPEYLWEDEMAQMAAMEEIAEDMGQDSYAEHEESKPLKPGNCSCLGIQCEQVTEMYQAGLTRFLEDQMEIKEGSIHVANGSRGSIQIAIHSLKDEKPRLCMEINTNGSVFYPHGSIGNDKKSRRFEGELLKSVMYYTAKIYDPAKDTGLSRYGFPPGNISIKPGTIPSVSMIEKASEKDTAYLFGHKLEFKQKEDGKTAWLDGKRIPSSTGQTLSESIATAMKKAIIADYEKIQDISKNLQSFLRDSSNHLDDLATLRQYSYGEIYDTVQKLITDRTTDGSSQKTRRDSILGHRITLCLEPASENQEHKQFRRIRSVELDGIEIYQAQNQVGKENIQEMRELLKNESKNVTTILQSTLAVSLESEGRFHISEKAWLIHKDLTGRMDGISDLDLKSGKLSDPILSCVYENDMETLQEQARKKLETIGLVGMEHIIAAFRDRDKKGNHMTVIEIREDYWDGIGEKILYSRSKAVTMSPEVQLEKSGGYTTVILQFDEAGSSDMERIWAVLTEHGKTAMDSESLSQEILVLTLTAVPMTLGGQYGMTATDPIYYTLQPAFASETVCRQIRILYLPESVLFLRDGSFQTEETIAKVKSEMAGEQLTKQAWYQKRMEEEAFKSKRDQETANYLENGKHGYHTFRSSREGNP